MKQYQRMGLFVALRYLNYKIFSRHRNGHGIHSPFIFNLVSDIFRNKTRSDIVCSIELIRKKLLDDTRLIQVTDLGAGSKRMKTSLRKVSDITRYSAIPRKYGILLSNMAEAFGKNVIIEFGTSLGISTLYLAASCPNASVITMEGCSEISSVASDNFREAGIKNITLLNGSFDDILPEIRKEKTTPGLVFIDGNHRKEPIIRYFSQVAEMSDKNSVIIIDDINSSREMAEAWYEIKNHKKVTASVDVFRMGIVFFKEGLNHFNYVVSY
ncbi:MAG TPA: SAM-dependent methyltransferase [Bacteroidales bacterium]|nr:SAM-dependent methyltransferase [Bacteroidales bacterium]HBZ21908.1 SAM-dependent methyltransferase [Bacteroidales bacterium]